MVVLVDPDVSKHRFSSTRAAHWSSCVIVPAETLAESRSLRRQMAVARRDAAPHAEAPKKLGNLCQGCAYWTATGTGTGTGTGIHESEVQSGNE